jgi:hypothetical protein
VLPFGLGRQVSTAIHENIIVGDWKTIVECPDSVARHKSIPQKLQWTTTLPQWELIGSMQAQNVGRMPPVRLTP